MQTVQVGKEEAFRLLVTSFLCDSAALTSALHLLFCASSLINTCIGSRSKNNESLIILDVPTVEGRLMVVDMAGSENIEQAGQIGFEAKMQTAKINQGNIALKRVVESIANGDSHVPFRDSKLTMLYSSHVLFVQDSFEDDKTKILMVLCASPDPKEIHKTISTLEYGAKAKWTGSGKKEEEINLKVTEVAQTLKRELEKKLEECQRMENEFVELERRRMEERILQQQQEVEILRRWLEEIELELCRSGDGNGGVAYQSDSSTQPYMVCLSTVSEEEEMEEEMEEEEGLKENVEAEEVEKKVIEEKRVCMVDGSSLQSNYNMGSLTSLPKDYQHTPTVNRPSRNPGKEDGKGGPDDRLVRIRKIFTLCGNYRELSQYVTSPAPTVASVKSENEQKLTEEINKSRVCDEMALASKENYNPSDVVTDADTEVYVKWEASKDNPGKFITTLKVVKDASLADLLVEIYLGADNQAFTFLMLGDPTGASVPKEKEATIQATKLPLCNNKSNGYHETIEGNAKPKSAPFKSSLPLKSLENRLPLIKVIKKD
ncbi:unnamed protein product [Prunus brigantina]